MGREKRRLIPHLVRRAGFGATSSELDMPWRLSIGPDSNVYVADWGNDRVSVFTQEGELVASYGESDTGEGQFTKPADVVADGDGNIYVCDWGNERVQVLNSEGEFLQLSPNPPREGVWSPQPL